LLITSHRRIVFIHDTYIFASILNYSILEKLLAIFINPQTTRKKTIEYKPPLDIIVDEEIDEFLRKNLYEKMGSSIESIEKIEAFIKNFKLYPSLEYLTRIYPRRTLARLVENDIVWIIPFKNINRISIRKIRGREYIEILYNCPVTGRSKAFHTYYSSETYELIKELCLFNENSNC
jgi:predicted house-cleaning noncanonical NTP pyrophosphatase (MazG superfamily)